MQQKAGQTRKQLRLGLAASSLLGGLGLMLACGGQTQPLNEVDDAVGGAGGTTGVSAATGGNDGEAAASGGSSSVVSTGGVTVSVVSAVTTGGSTFGGASTTGGGPIPRTAFADKLDVLFVVDNSIGMAEKQKYLVMAAQDLVRRLVDPAEGSSFAPLTDIRLGVISSSLGGHGGDICSPNSPGYNPTQNDAAHLLPTLRPDLEHASESGFLTWDPQGKYADGEGDLDALQAALGEHILSAGELGCGFEAPLEALYRFLVEPSPPLEIVVSDGMAGPARDASGAILIDEELLAQREAFLRPDAALAVVLLSDEDDCSILDSGPGYVAASATLGGGAVFTMPSATSACATDPNDACCRSCGVNEAAPPASCVPLAEDPGCVEPRDPDTDPLNLRCFDQKRRFGMDLLYPIDRYVTGLTAPEVVDTHRCQGDCPIVDNPLFPAADPDGAFRRTARDVFVLSLVGVPWQDLATEESLSGTDLTYQSEAGSLSQDVWQLVVGEPSAYVPPGDPLMLPSASPRMGVHPITGEPLGSEDSTDPQANSINGHEFPNTSSSRLQYACTFELESPKDCQSGEVQACDCTATELQENNPVCQPPGGGAAETTQYYGSAVPGLRHLELLSQLPGSVPASICPKLTSGEQKDASFGYNPAMRALLQRLAPALTSTQQ